MSRIPMTAAGAEKLKRELEELKSVTRPSIVKAIAEARAHGDLKENAEYHAAREQQSFVEGRIQEVQAKLSNVQIIDVSKLEKTGKVIFGSTVDLQEAETEQTVTYQIVGEDEADIKQGKISIGSPVARALIGKQEGDSVEVQTPRGIVEYFIEQVKYI